MESTIRVIPEAQPRALTFTPLHVLFIQEGHDAVLDVASRHAQV